MWKPISNFTVTFELDLWPTSSVFVDSISQGIDRLDIQVVRRFVLQNENTAFTQDKGSFQNSNIPSIL